MPELEPGKYTLTLRAWDVLNNAGEHTVTFTVVDKNQVEIQDLIAYPNPTSGETKFKFKHNQAGSMANVQLQIYDYTGREVTNHVWNAEGVETQNSIFTWDGKKHDGNAIITGLYVYKLTVTNIEGALQTRTGRISVL